jgi:hypothetical protein
LFAAEFQGDAHGDAMHPIAERRRLANGRSPPRKDEKRGLERVLGIVRTAQRSPADAQHHRPMPLGDDPERGLVFRFNESAQQLLVGGSAQGLCLQQFDNRPHGRAR